MRAWWQEIRPTFALAVPIILGQLGQMLMPLIDSAMIGRLGVTPLAAVAFGTLIVWIPMIMGFGLCVAVHVLVASAAGAGRRDEAGEVLRHGLTVVVIYGGACGLFLANSTGWLDHIPRVDPHVIRAAEPFVLWMGWSTVPVLLFTAVKNYCESLGHPRLPLAILGGSLLLNIFFNYLFIFGHGGMPALGVAGAGVSTLLARSAAFVALFTIIWRIPALRPRWDRGWRAPLSTTLTSRLLGLGIPSAIQILFEVSLFNFATLLAGMISTITLAAHQIALNVASLAFMVPLGLSMTTAIRVGRAVGAGQFIAARRIGWSSIIFGAGFMAAYALFVLATRQYLPRLFLSATAPDAPAVFHLAATLLAWAAAFAMFDGAQATALGALRGLYDVRLPTALLFTAYWAISAPLAWYLGLHLLRGGPGVWEGLTIGVVVVATLLVARFHIISRRRAFAEPSAAAA
jgi:MATE family multidrug resistance protein